MLLVEQYLEMGVLSHSCVGCSQLDRSEVCKDAPPARLCSNVCLELHHMP